MNYVCFLCILSTLLFFPCTTRTSGTSPYQDTEKQRYNQPIPSPLPDYFFRPLTDSKEDLIFFLQTIYNDKRYPQGFLSENFMHVIHGLNFAHRLCQPRLTMDKVLSLFDPKLDNIYINPYVFSHYLHEVQPTIARYCNKNEEKLSILEAIKECVGSYLIDNYALLKQDPEKALDDLAHALYTITVEPEDSESDIRIRELQHIVYHFLSHGLSQLIWNPANQGDTWINVKILSCQLEQFNKSNIIDTKMLDSLLWTLLHRYSYFISLVAKELKPEFFDEVRADLSSEQAAPWLLPEKEAYITTKLDFLRTVFLEAEVTAQVDALAQETPFPVEPKAN